MTEQAKKVYKVAERHGIAALLENRVDDLDAFSAEISGESEEAILHWLYIKIC